MSVLWVLFAALVLGFLQAWVFGTFGQKRLEYNRTFSQDAVHEGDGVQLVEVLRNRKPLPVPWLRIESRISPFLRFHRAGGDDREINAEQYHKSVFFIAPFCQITRRHEISCEKRGIYSVGTLAVTSGDLFALVQKVSERSLDCRLTVYPRLLSESELPPAAMRWQGELIVKRFIMPDPFLINGIRDYRPGDPLRSVHWGATARMGGRLQVKQFDTTSDPRALIILNVQTTEEQWGELMDYEQPVIEQGIRIAATLAMRALSCGVEAGFASNACYQGEKGQGKCIYIPARHSADQAETLFTAMARLQIFRELTFPQFLGDMTQVSGADIIVLSCYTSPAVEEAMNRLRARGNTVELVRIDGEAVA